MYKEDILKMNLSVHSPSFYRPILTRECHLGLLSAWMKTHGQSHQCTSTRAPLLVRTTTWVQASMSASSMIALFARVAAFCEPCPVAATRGGCLRAVTGVDRENLGLSRARMSPLVCGFCFKTSRQIRHVCDSRRPARRPCAGTAGFRLATCCNVES